MNEEIKKDEGKVAPINEKSSASGLQDSKLDEVVGGKADIKDFNFTHQTDKSSPVF